MCIYIYIHIVVCCFIKGATLTLTLTLTLILTLIRILILLMLTLMLTPVLIISNTINIKMVTVPQKGYAERGSNRQITNRSYLSHF